MNKTRLAYASAAVGVLMFAFGLFSFRPRLSPLLVVASFAVAVVGAASWGVGFCLLMRLASRYAGVDLTNIPADANRRFGLTRVIIIALMMAPPIAFIALHRYDYFLSYVAAPFGPMLTLLPLTAKPWVRRRVLVRGAAGIVGGTALALGVYAFSQDISVTLESVVVCTLFALAWGVAHVVSLWRERATRSVA